MARRAPELVERYGILLTDHLDARDELTLNAAYELGRAAMLEGFGVLDVAHAHRAALQQVAAAVELHADDLEAAGAFLSECLSAFDMSHRGVREANQALRRINETLEAEVRRIAHALHDEAGQLLASVHIALAEIADATPPELRPRLEQVSWLLTRIEEELRHLSHELHPTVLDDLGLGPALEQLAERVGRRHKLRIVVQVAVEERLPPAVESALYRTVQEALNNVVRHAKARLVRVAVARHGGRVTCTVHDDGVGLRHGAVVRRNGGLGLSAMRERLAALGGRLQLDSTPERGTTLHAALQLAESESERAQGRARR